MSETVPENEKGMSKEQEELLEYLENEFKDRYTEADKEFKYVWENDLPPPPIFVDWEQRYDNRSDSNYRRDYRDNNYRRDYRDNNYRRGYKAYRNYRQPRYEAYNRPWNRPY